MYIYANKFENFEEMDDFLENNSFPKLNPVEIESLYRVISIGKNKESTKLR